MPFSRPELTFEFYINLLTKSCRVSKPFIPFAVLLFCPARDFFLDGFIFSKTSHNVCPDKEWNEISLQNCK